MDVHVIHVSRKKDTDNEYKEYALMGMKEKRKPIGKDKYFSPRILFLFVFSVNIKTF